MLITKVSIFTGKTNTLDLPVTQEQMDEYATGNKLIQYIFPKLSRGEREFIKTGVTPEEWEKMFGKEE